MKRKTTFLTKALTLLFVMLSTLTGARAETLTVYDGTQTSPYAPAYIYQFDDHARSQFVIPANQLSTMNGCTIFSLKFYTNKRETYTTPDVVDVYLKEINRTTLNAFEAKSGIVYQGMLYIAGNGELTITLQTPYVYNGGNLLIGIENITDINNESVQFYGKNGSRGSSIYGYSEDSLDEVSPTQSRFIPKTTFTYFKSPVITSVTPSYTSANLSWTGSFSSYEIKYREAGFFDDFQNGLGRWTIYTQGGSGEGSNGWLPYLGMASSWSWNGEAYDVDNWLVTPEVKLNGTLKFEVLTHPDWADSYEVLLSTTGNAIEDFTTTLRTMATATNGTVTIDLSSYAGQTGYIAIRHVSYDCNYLDIDNFEISSGGEWMTVTTTENSIDLNSLTPNTQYEFIITGIDGSTQTSTALTYFITLDGVLVKIGSIGYSTLYYGKKNLVVPEGVEAYTYKPGNGKMQISKMYAHEGVIPADDAVVLKGEPGTYLFPAKDGEYTKDSDNLLRGYDVDHETEGGTYYYALSTVGGKNLGFHWLKANGAAFTSAAHKAYLPLDVTFANLVASGEGEAKSYVELPDEDDPTSINKINVNTNDDVIYNLAGQRINKVQKGINIVNGKKILF